MLGRRRGLDVAAGGERLGGEVRLVVRDGRAGEQGGLEEEGGEGDEDGGARLVGRDQAPNSVYRLHGGFD